MSQSPAIQPTPPPARHEKRVSTLVGDRLCIKCAYNLVGQPVLREAHYDMLIVRCPECATVASLQEHPVLGRWAARWAVVLIGLWVIVLLCCLFASALILFGVTEDVGSTASESYVNFLAVRQDQSFPYGHRSAYYVRLNSDWWELQDPDALLAEAGGWMAIADWRALWRLVFWCLPLVPIGCVWSLLLPHVPRRLLPLWSLVLCASATVIVAIGQLDQFYSDWWIGSAVFHQVGLKVQLVALALAAVPITVGLLLGRMLARLLVRALLPPRLRSSLAGLWLIDGLAPPPGARDYRVNATSRA